MLKNARATASYSISFPGAGTDNFGAHTTTGSVTEKASNLFADIQVNMLNMIPQSIKNYTVRSGHDGLEQNTGSSGDMKAIDETGMRKSLLQNLQNTMLTNVKVQINKAITTYSATG